MPRSSDRLFGPTKFPRARFHQEVRALFVLKVIGDETECCCRCASVFLCLYLFTHKLATIRWSAAGDDHVESVRFCGHMVSGFRRFHSEFKIAKNQNTFAKRQREQEKRQRADEKRKKRDKKKDGSFAPAPSRSYAFPSEDREE